MLWMKRLLESSAITRALPVVVITAFALFASPSRAESTGGTPPVDASPHESGRWTVDFRVGVGFDVTSLSGVMVSSYTPTLQFSESGTGIAGQTLALDSGSAPALTLGIDLWPSRRAGIQLLVDWTSADIGGSSSPYSIRLEYEARQPPDYEPRQYVVERTTPWPDPSGELQRLTLALNGLTRWDASRHVAVTLSGGVTSTRLTGDLDSLGFTSFRLGGHSVLFSEEHRVGMELDPVWVTGFDLGATIEYALSGRVALVAGYLYLGGSDARVPVHVRDVLNPDEILVPMSVSDIEAALKPGTVRIESARSRVYAGIRFTVH